MMPVLIAFARLSVDVAPPVTVLSTDAGERRFVAIRGGTMEGDIAAEILPGGADWQWVGADGVVEIDAHYTQPADQRASTTLANSLDVHR